MPAAVRGIVHVPAHNTPIKPGRREALLIAIAKAREWMDDLAHSRGFAAIARREAKVGAAYPAANAACLPLTTNRLAPP
jgi:hypothetical protein